MSKVLTTAIKPTTARAEIDDPIRWKRRVYYVLSGLSTFSATFVIGQGLSGRYAVACCFAGVGLLLLWVRQILAMDMLSVILKRVCTRVDEHSSIISKLPF